MALASLTPIQRADQLLTITERLSVLVKSEIEALKSGQLNASSQDWNEKERLAHAYRLEMSQIHANPKLLAGLPAETRNMLMSAVETFQTILNEHAMAIIGMKDVTEGLVRAISEEVASTNAAPSGYSAGGTVQKPKDGSGSGFAANVKV